MTKEHPQDPFADREAEKYDNPIASRELILALLKDHKAPLSQRTIARQLGIKDEEATEALRRRLRAMERDGQIYMVTALWPESVALIGVAAKKAALSKLCNAPMKKWLAACMRMPACFI